ncbi:MAG TPA: glycosyltransferase family 39 protein [Chloroflexia bacterium]|nr:glycosyltransferase family 39 protein [Chloroflexia bacterium]
MQTLQATNVQKPWQDQPQPKAARAGLKNIVDWWLVGFLVLGLASRLFAITAQSIWLDEAYSVFTVKYDLGFIWNFTVNYDQHPPLYYVLLHSWVQVFGDGLMAVRMLSVVFAVPSIWFIYLVAGRLFDRNTGRVAAFILALSPFHIWYSQETRMYSMVVFFVLLSAYFLVCAMQENRIWQYCAFSFFTIIAIYSDYSAFYYLVGSGLFSLYFIWQKPRRFLPMFISYLVVGLAYIPWIPVFLHQFSQVYSGFWISPPTFSTVWDTFLSFSSLDSPNRFVNTIIVVILLAWVFVIPDKRNPEKRNAYFFLVIFLLAPILVSLVFSLRQPIYLTRTVISAAVPFYILLARAIVGFKSIRLGAIFLVPLILLNLASIWVDSSATIKEDWRGTVNFVAANAKPTDLIIFNAPYVEMPFDYFWTDKVKGTSLTTVDRRGYPADETLAHNGRSEPLNLTNALKANDRIWVVASHTDGSDPAGFENRLIYKQFKLVNQQEFKDIKVLLFQKQPGGTK